MDPLRQIDLNLLLALSHLLETASVHQAAQELGVGQPAMSASLARLRTIFDDPLLIRAGRGMRRTERAEELRGPAQDLVDRTRGLLVPVTPFDPKVDPWVARLAISDETRGWLGPRLVARVAAAAPRVELRIRRLTLDSPRAGRTGEIDLAVFPDPGGIPPSAGARPDVTPFVVRPLYRTRFVVVTAADHPLAGAPWTVADYLAADHVLVVSWEESDRGFVDDHLASQGLARRIVVTVPTFDEALALVRASRLVTVVPEACARTGDLRCGPLPWGERPLQVVHAWHPRATRDPRVTWLREQVLACAC